MASKSTQAVVLLSGGLDSTTALAWAIRQQGWRCHTLAFDYGQRHRVELEAARNISESLGAASHRVIAVDLRAIGGSALTDHIDVPRDAHQEQGVPVTYVPARNLIFLSLAAAWAERVQADRLVIGANVRDYSGYPDCREEFLRSFSNTVNLATKAACEEGRRLEVVAPLIRMDKAEIIRLGLRLGVDYAMTRSCYDPLDDGRPCGHCDSCHYRQEGFQRLGLRDPWSG